jgi:hypothetical protein
MILGALSSSSLFLILSFPQKIPLLFNIPIPLPSPRCRALTIVGPQLLCRVDVEPVPQALAASRMEEKDPTNCCCRACCTRSLFFLCLTFPVPLGTRTPVSNICGHGERWTPEAHAWDVVRTRADICPRRNHDR